jgi:anaerobic ribonucleoside-triphosphate reductase
MPYITITPTFSICPKHGYLSGEWDFCPTCDEALGITADRFDAATRAAYTSLEPAR